MSKHLKKSVYGSDDIEGFQPNPMQSFDTFVVGADNRFAYEAALAVAEDPAQLYNPLYIYGGSGLGKSHLMHAIVNHVKRKNASARIIHITAEKLLAELIEYVKTNRVEAFREHYRHADFVLIDDIHYIAGKSETQRELLFTFDALVKKNTQVVISSTSIIGGAERITEGLKSRFLGGLSIELRAPDEKTRVAILRKRLESEGILVDDDILVYIASVFQHDIRMLNGGLTCVIAHSLMLNKELTLGIAKKVLGDKVNLR